jgi:probable HAF family extracellular repeat protein
MHNLGTLGGGFSYAYGINASGWVTGDAYTTGNAADHAFLYDGTMHDLGTLGGTVSIGEAINASGWVTGASYTTGDNNNDAFLYNGTMHDLGTLGGDESEGLAIDAAGRVVGDSFTADDASQDAFLYQDGQMYDLNALLTPSSPPWTLFMATAINEHGQIAGFGAIDGENHAFLLNPVPEPSSLAIAVLACGALAVYWLKQRCRQF